MRLRHIELFQAILQTGSLTAAAELLHISQPAASKISSMPSSSSASPLFDRVRGKLQPTAEARLRSSRPSARHRPAEPARRRTISGEATPEPCV